MTPADPAVELAVVTAERDRLADELAKLKREQTPVYRVSGAIAYGMGTAVAVLLGLCVVVAAAAALYAVARYGFTR